MTKTNEAIRTELEDLKNTIFQMKEDDKKLRLLCRRDRKKMDRIVQVLLNNLPKEQLNSKVVFNGFDCHGDKRDWSSGEGYTLSDFLWYIVDP